MRHADIRAFLLELIEDYDHGRGDFKHCNSTYITPDFLAYHQAAGHVEDMRALYRAMVEVRADNGLLLASSPEVSKTLQDFSEKVQRSGFVRVPRMPDPNKVPKYTETIETMESTIIGYGFNNYEISHTVDQVNFRVHIVETELLSIFFSVRCFLRWGHFDFTVSVFYFNGEKKERLVISSSEITGHRIFLRNPYPTDRLDPFSLLEERGAPGLQQVLEVCHVVCKKLKAFLVGADQT